MPQAIVWAFGVLGGAALVRWAVREELARWEGEAQDRVPVRVQGVVTDSGQP